MTNANSFLKALINLIIITCIGLGCQGISGQDSLSNADLQTIHLKARIQNLLEKIARWQKNKTKSLVIVLENDLFETDKADLRTNTLHDIKIIAAFLKKNPKLKMVIKGHTDNTSTHLHNLGFSERRATTVKFALMKQGIISKRLFVKGLGETQPIASNHTAIGRQKNHRVELVITRL